MKSKSPQCVPFFKAYASGNTESTDAIFLNNHPSRDARFENHYFLKEAESNRFEFWKEMRFLRTWEIGYEM